MHAFRSVRSMAMAKADISDSPQLKPLRMCDTVRLETSSRMEYKQNKKSTFKLSSLSLLACFFRVGAGAGLGLALDGCIARERWGAWDLI